MSAQDRLAWWGSAMLARAPVPLLAVDREWRVVHATDDFLLRAQRTAADLGRSLWELFPTLIGSDNERELRATMRDGVDREFVADGPDGWYRVHVRSVLDGLLVSIIDLTEQKETEQQVADLADAQGMLRRVAEAVVRGTPPEKLFEMIAREIGQSLGVRAASVGRDLGGTHTDVLGNWSSDVDMPLRLGVRESDPSHEFRRALTLGRPVRSSAADGTLSHVFAAAGCQAAFAVPIYAGGRLWGGLITASMDPHAYTGDDARRQIELGELTGLAIGNAEAQAQLVQQATSDPLTGLANHRTFHESLHAAVIDAEVRELPLSLVLFDVDDFRVVNEMRGHRAGDRLLSAAANALRGLVHEGELLARVGGDEFAFLLPGVGGDRALERTEEARRVIAAALLEADGTAITTSAGVCELSSAESAERLFELADGALYWSKAHGRNRAFVFDPEVVRELSALDRARQLERTRTLIGISALARAIDAKDPATRRHSDRVAALATRLAEATGWSTPAISRLQEAALVHDVGKIGVPDAILLKPGPLSEPEYEQMKRHATLGSEMLQGVLTEEQVQWVRGHHERPDGTGYPDGLTAGEIDDGAALLAQADAFEAIVTRRIYSPARTVADAVAECVALSGAQFLPIATEALQTLHAGGALEAWSRAGVLADAPDAPPPTGAGVGAPS